MAACGRLCLVLEVCPTHTPFNRQSHDPLCGIGGRLQGTSRTGPLFWSRTAPQNSLVWGDTAAQIWLASCPLPGPLPPAMLSAETWEEASDYFIA